MRRFTLSLTAFATFVVLALSGVTALAQNPLDKACQTGQGASQSAACQDRGNFNNPVVGQDSLLLRAADLIAVATGVIAVIAIIIAGIRFATSSGDPQSVNAAKNTILYAVIGLIVIVVARGIIVFVVNNI